MAGLAWLVNHGLHTPLSPDPSHRQRERERVTNLLEQEDRSPLVVERRVRQGAVHHTRPNLLHNHHVISK